MQKDWPVLKTPPIILAIFQLKFTKELNENLGKMINNDREIRQFLPLRSDNLHSNIDMQGTIAPGISTLKAKTDTKITAYTYYTENKKKKLIIQDGSITFINEEFYVGWDKFKQEVEKCIEVLKTQLDNCEINRTSIRFVNKFNIVNFEDPLEFFTQTISTDSEESYPLNKYSYKINYSIPDTNITAIINNALEPYENNDVYYYLDIDVLDHSKFLFDKKLISKYLEKIRFVKNKLFFDTLKQKAIDLCN